MMPRIEEETKEEFMERYQLRSKVKMPNLFTKYLIVLPCDCDDGGGPTHWAAVHREPGLIDHHLQFCAPPGTPWPEEIPRTNVED